MEIIHLNYIEPKPPNDLDIHRVFTCGHCRSNTQHNYHTKHEYNFMYDSYNDNKYALSEIVCTICMACQRVHLFENKYECSDRWDYSTVLLYPNPLEAPLPSEDMPEAIQKIYNEARAVLPHSPSASCLLLRKALETLLCQTLQKEKGNLDTLINDFFKKYDYLTQHLKPAFEAIRIYGNDGGHYRELDLSDDKETALTLCNCLNHIIASTITHPRTAQNLLVKNPKAEKIVQAIYSETENCPF